ncbi:hypothetical protein [Desulfatirhabdium butyrativorans]|uniref:hypothetical protein n=1 Tax=Desulfatirhabdium butyrativorans TaxID=340467 RepID=UPI00042527E6|nr:hypothetical protein [Desulfatirhabdium butyrativorans]
MPEIIKCQFNLFDEGRKYTGHHRKYILESATAVCYAPETREGIQLREKFGYFGHGRRMLTGKLQLGETELVKLPNGQQILVENIPSNVTTFFEVSKNGDVEHHQELLLENEPGRVVMGLHKSRVGGFSWACGGADGGRMGATRINSFEGFDYVLNPGFAKNRGYILESADAPTRDMILENIGQMGVKDPESRLNSWLASVQLYADDLAERLAQAEIYESTLMEQIESGRSDIESLKQRMSDLQAEKAQLIDSRKQIITECARKSVIAIPDRVQEAMISMANERDFYDMVNFFESAKRVDLSMYPVNGNSGSVQRIARPVFVDAPEYGSHAAGIDFERVDAFFVKK